MKATVIDIGSDYIIVRHQFGIDGIYFDEEKLKQVSIGQEIELNINLPEGSKPIMQMPPIKCIEVSSYAVCGIMTVWMVSMYFASGTI